MHNILNFEKCLNQIKTILLRDSQLVALVSIPSENCLKQIGSLSQDNYNTADKFIQFTPLLLDSEEYSQPVGIAIQLQNVTFYNEVSAVYAITVVCEDNSIQLSNNQNRLLQICNRIIQLLENQKMAPTTTMDVDNLSLLVYDNGFTGYVIKCSVFDNTDVKDF